jgi:uncharacterized protein with HEPN domain
MRDDRSRLLDIMEAIAGIEKYSIFGKTRFLEDELVRTFVIYQLQIIGEAAYKLSPELRTKHVEIPWPKVLGMRHVLVHDYFRVDFDIVWEVVELDIPPLKAQIREMLNEAQPRGQ